METKVKLSDIVDALETQNDQTSFYLDTSTGVVHFLSPDDLYAGEEDNPLEEYPEWQRQTIAIARRLAKGDDESLIELPTRWDVNEYGIMEAFRDMQPEGIVCDALHIAIQGKGAFRRFKDAVQTFGLFDKWHRFRLTRFKSISIAWCQANGIAYIDDAQE